MGRSSPQFVSKASIYSSPPSPPTMAGPAPPRRSTRPRARIDRFVAGPATRHRSRAPGPGFFIPPGSDVSIYSLGLEVRLDDIFSPLTQRLASKAIAKEVPLAGFAQDTPMLVKSYNENIAIPAQNLPPGLDPRCVDWPRRLAVVKNPKHDMRCRCADCPGLGPRRSIDEVRHLMQVDSRFKDAKFRTHSGRTGKFQQILCPKAQPTFYVQSLAPVQDFNGQDHVMCPCCPFCSCIACRKSKTATLTSYSPVAEESPDCSIVAEIEDESNPNLFAAVL